MLLPPVVTYTYKINNLFLIYFLFFNNLYLYLCQQRETKTKKMKNQEAKQSNTYKVVYSDGITVLDYIIASNLTEAKKKAAENAKVKNYRTAYYKVARCYSGGVNALTENWH